MSRDMPSDSVKAEFVELLLADDIAGIERCLERHAADREKPERVRSAHERPALSARKTDEHSSPPAAPDGESATSPRTVVDHRFLAPRIPGYRILEELGRGGMSRVFRARNLAADRDVAIKVFGSRSRRGPSAGSATCDAACSDGGVLSSRSRCRFLSSRWGRPFLPGQSGERRGRIFWIASSRTRTPRSNA